MQAATADRRRKFSVDELTAMVRAGILAEDEPLELLEGELLVVSPQGPGHATTIELLRRKLESAYDSQVHCRDGKPMVASPDSLPEPDLMVVQGPVDAYRGRHPAGNDVLLAVEVAVSSRARDRRKIRIYARAGVAVVWIVDVERGVVEVFDELRDGRYRHRTLDATAELSLPESRGGCLSVADVLG